MRRIALIIVMVCAALTRAGAQPAEPAAGIAKLREHEATYQAGLQKLQTPLLNDYALKLQELAAASPESDQLAIRAELARVRKLIDSGGIVDLRSASSTQAQVTAPLAASRTPPGAVLVLKPDTAKGPAVLGSSLTIGKAEWTIPSLDAGSYEVTVLCSFAPFSGTASIGAALDGKEINKELSSANAAGMPGQFPVLRLGRFQFDADVKNKDLKLELNATELTGVQVRQVVISRPRPSGK